MESKVCKTCKLPKLLTEFHKRKLSKDGLDLHCKDCKSEYNRKYKKEWLTPEKSKEVYKKWPKNKESVKNWRYNNKSRINECRKKIIENYTEEEYKEFRTKINNRRRNRLKIDELYKLRCNISSRLSKALKSIKESKDDIKTIDTLGCDLYFFKEYIESKWEDWMTWENYGRYNKESYYGWDIDHIIPISVGKTKEEIIKLNHYTNLQPLCSRINRDIKKDKLEDENRKV